MYDIIERIFKLSQEGFLTSFGMTTRIMGSKGRRKQRRSRHFLRPLFTNTRHSERSEESLQNEKTTI